MCWGSGWGPTTSGHFPRQGQWSDSEVAQKVVVLQGHGVLADVRAGPLRADVGVVVVPGCVTRQARPELLEVEPAAHLVHLIPGRVHGGQERQEPGHHDPGGDREIRPAERDPGGDEVEDRPLRGPVGDEQDSSRGEPGGRLERVAVVEQSVQGPIESGGPVVERRVEGEFGFRDLEGGAFELTEGVIQQVIWFHRINRSHLVGTPSPSPEVSSGRHEVAT